MSQVITDLEPEEELINQVDDLVYNSTFAIFGGAGYIGSHVAQLLMAKGAKKVMIVDNLGGDRTTKRYEVLKAQKIDCIQLDIDNDFETIEEIIMQESELDYVLYLAFTVEPYASVLDPQSICTEINRFTKVISMISTMDSVKKFVYASSADVYGEKYSDKELHEYMKCNPQTPYAAMMHSCESIASSFTGTVGLPTLGLRFFTIYGPDQRTVARSDEQEYDLNNVAVWIKNAFNGEPLVLDCTENDIISMCHINDCAELVVRAIVGPIGDNKLDYLSVLNIADSFYVNKLEVAELIATMVAHYLKLDKPCAIEQRPINFMQCLITGEEETDDSSIVSYQKANLTNMVKYTQYIPQMNLMKAMQDTISISADIYIGRLQAEEEMKEKMKNESVNLRS